MNDPKVMFRSLSPFAAQRSPRTIDRFSLIAISILCSWGIGTSLGQEKGGSGAIDYGSQIRPILANKCFACHGPDAKHREADLRLDDRTVAIASAIQPGKASSSPLLLRVLEKDPEKVMPPPHAKKVVTAEEQELLRQWIDQGAPYARHWAFNSVPETVELPSVRNASWIRNPIDRFVLKELEKRSLQPALEASRERWLRRVTFDLTGLPPSLEEIDTFLADSSADAYERVVDRLLKSSAYGERMAADWLDAARYADTFGYQADREMHVWPWRDWVIQAFQNNLPYDQFLLWQIAGDLLPNATRDQKLATAFNRLHRQTNEGGSIEEEFRIEYVADRVRTMGTAMLGLTLECSRCHDHKYDPISQREYYSLTAYFNNIDEHGLYSHFTETAPTPTLLLYEGEQEAKHQSLLKELDELRMKRRSHLESAFDAAKEMTFKKYLSEGEIQTPQPNLTFDFDEHKATGDMKVVAGRLSKAPIASQGKETDAKTDQAIEFGGDDSFQCKGAPLFSRPKPFTLAMWVKPMEEGGRMLVAHQSRAAEDSAFRGFSLVLDHGHPTISLVHFWPGNAIQVRSLAPIPLGEWTHLAITYDGSSRAEGLHLYVDGGSRETAVVRDRLTRDFTHRKDWGDSDADNMHLALGARFRDIGFKRGAIDDVAIFESQLTAVEVGMLWEGQRDHSKIEPKTVSLSAELLGKFAMDRWKEHWLLRHDPEWKGLEERYRQLSGEENELNAGVRQIMAMEEMTARRKTYLLTRGAYDARADEVSPSTPQEIFAWNEELSRDRLGFGKWMIDRKNPLTSRVAVNRVWRIFFGRGLVATSEDFGNQGEAPTHPELLDYLANRLMQENWDIQKLCKSIVLSSTYRQSSEPSDRSLFQSDPANRWLARGPRHRLTAEQLRDNALFVSGLLERRIGGKSVFPYQPAGLWEEAGTGKHYTPSKGKDLYRRSMYSFWRRTSPPPTMTTFDAPSREFCVARREPTATPLQALTLLNDPQYVEAARVLAEKLVRELPTNPSQRWTNAFRMLTSRQPTAEESKLMEELYEKEKGRFQSAPEEAKKFLAIGEAKRDESLSLEEVVASTVIIQILMNFDESVTKR